MSDAHDAILVTMLSDAGWWFPQVMKPAELAKMLGEFANYDADAPRFRVWDIDTEGEPHECEIEYAAGDYNDDDFATVSIRVVRKDTGEFVAGTAYQLDGRA
jgi:hypothetical protein